MSGQPETAIVPDRGVKRILLVQTAFLGDCVLTLPLIEGVRQKYPEAKLTVLGIPASAGLFRGVEGVDEVISFDKRGEDSGLGGTLRLIADLRKRSFDLALLPHRSFRSSLMVWLAGVRERIGYSGVPGSPLYTKQYPRPESAHEGARNLALLGDDGRAIDPRPRLKPHEPSREMAVEWLNRHGLKKKSAIALAPGSVWATKRWPESSWTLLAKQLTEAGHDVVIVGGPADRDLGDRIIAGNSRTYNSAGEMKVLQSAELLRECSLLITGDTAPLHLAVAVETPVLAIFGPTVPEFGFAPTGDHDRIIGLDLECRPCAIHGSDECPLGHHNCMRRLAAGRVYSTALEML